MTTDGTDTELIPTLAGHLRDCMKVLNSEALEGTLVFAEAHRLRYGGPKVDNKAVGEALTRGTARTGEPEPDEDADKNGAPTRRTPTMTTGKKPQSIAELASAVMALLTSNEARNPGTAARIRTLIDEASPHEIDSRIQKIEQAAVIEGAAVVEARVTSRQPGEPEHRVWVHPSVGAIYRFAETIAALSNALAKADRNARWEEAETIGKSLVRALNTEPLGEDGDQVRETLKRVRSGRLAQVAPSTARQIEDARNQRMAIPVALGGNRLTPTGRRAEDPPRDRSGGAGEQAARRPPASHGVRSTAAEWTPTRPARHRSTERSSTERCRSSHATGSTSPKSRKAGPGTSRRSAG